MGYIRIPIRIYYTHLTAKATRPGVIQYTCEHCGQRNIEVIKLERKASGNLPSWASEGREYIKGERLKERAEAALDRKEERIRHAVNDKHSFGGFHGTFICSRCGNKAKWLEVPQCWIGSVGFFIWISMLAVFACFAVASFKFYNAGILFPVIFWTAFGLTAVLVPIFYIAYRKRKLKGINDLPEYLSAEEFKEAIKQEKIREFKKNNLDTSRLS